MELHQRAKAISNRDLTKGAISCRVSVCHELTPNVRRSVRTAMTGCALYRTLVAIWSVPDCDQIGTWSRSGLGTSQALGSASIPRWVDESKLHIAGNWACSCLVVIGLEYTKWNLESGGVAAPTLQICCMAATGT